jgi:hypothetical protein
MERSFALWAASGGGTAPEHIFTLVDALWMFVSWPEAESIPAAIYPDQQLWQQLRADMVCSKAGVGVTATMGTPRSD